MNGYAFTTEIVISEFTLTFLEDSGYYNANYYTGGIMQFGNNKGFEFVFKKCINDGNINPKFSNEFFNETYTGFDTSCSSKHQSTSYHMIFVWDSIPKQYWYFKNINWGGYAPADFCPVSSEDSNKEGQTIFDDIICLFISKFLNYYL